jgi:hypothetical protein
VKHRFTAEDQHWALDRVDKLARASYETYQLSPRLGERRMADALDQVVDDLLAEDPAHTAALVHCFAVFLGHYMRQLSGSTGRLAEQHLADLVNHARHLLEE